MFIFPDGLEFYCIVHSTKFEDPRINGGDTYTCPRCGRPLRVRKVKTERIENTNEIVQS